MLLKEVIGNEKEKQHLVSTAVKDKISHAQLFVGKEGCGALPLAIAYAQFINCTNKQENDSCGTCPSCLKYNNIAHPDLHFIYPNATTPSISSNPSSEQFIKEWRELIQQNPYINTNDWFEYLGIENKQGIINKRDSDEFLKHQSLKAYEAKYKVTIVWMAEKMNAAFANKILKILEEPPENTLFILICENTEFLLPTIISRVQKINLSLPKVEEIVSYLVNNGVDNELANHSAIASENNLRKAIVISRTEGSNNVQETFEEWMRTCYKKDIPGTVHWTERVAKIGREHQKQLLNSALVTFRKCIVHAFSPELNTYVNDKEKGFVSKFSPFVNEVNIIQITEEFNKAIQHIERNGNPKPIFLDLSLKTMKLLTLKRRATV